MNILQLCIFSNFWNPSNQVTSIDLRLGKDIFSTPPITGSHYDLVCAAPPCDQFTKANASNWKKTPNHFIMITAHCINICLHTKSLWFLENPPGRIEKFFPILTNYRIITWRSQISNKEYIVYGNFLCMQPHIKRYSGHKSISNKSKKQREIWTPDFIPFIESQLTNHFTNS